MNPMLIALKKKMDSSKLSSKPDLEIDMADKEPGDDETAGPAPGLEHEPMHGGPDPKAMEHGDADDADAHLAAAHEDMQHMKAVRNEDESESAEGKMGGDDQKEPYEGSLLHMSILKGLGDHSTPGRGPMGLKERAAQGANEKIAAIEAMKKKKGF